METLSLGIEQKYAEVIVDLPSRELDHPFAYQIPFHLASQVRIGSMVLVPFAHRREIGYVTGFTSQAPATPIETIEALLEEIPVFSSKMAQLCHWIADYYFSTLSEVLKLAFPAGRKRQVSRQIILNSNLADLKNCSKRQQALIELIAQLGGKISAKELAKKFQGASLSAILRPLEEKNIVSSRYVISAPKANIKLEQYAELNKPADVIKFELAKLGQAPKQQQILQFLLQAGKPLPARELLAATNSSPSSLKSLAQLGYIKLCPVVSSRQPETAYFSTMPSTLVLSQEQIFALGSIKQPLDEHRHQIFLIQGVTGSGKTEIYLQAVAHTLAQGRTAIIIVPEIALTAQTVERFRSKFGKIVAILHSGLSVGERFDQWRGLKSGEYRVVVGARSALFAPLENLGLIIVDEEHETTYKQNRNPRYQARDVAIKRGELESAVVILGSATPSLESKFMAEQKKYQLISLTSRVEKRPLPQIKIIDLRQELKAGNRSIFSAELLQEISNCLDAEAKVILFLNRRGYSSFVLCRECGLVIKCKRCAVSLTYHQSKHLLKCHHCGHQESAPQICPKCQGYYIRYFGVGTQRVESEIKALFPGLTVIRMDADTTAGRDLHRQKLIEFKHLKKGILLGTQMIAKGLDFPEITLVGVINADTALHLPDFRAAERTFQLMMQVAGRAGRGSLPGKVIIQTYCPENYAIASLLKANYDAFYAQEIDFRKELDYPPCSNLINILISGQSETKTAEAAMALGRLLATEHITKLAVMLGPVPAPIPRLKNRYRWHITFKTHQPTQLKNFLKEHLKHFSSDKIVKEINVSVDVDPMWVL